MTQERPSGRALPKARSRLLGALLIVVGLGLAFVITRSALVQRLPASEGLEFDPQSGSALTQAAEIQQSEGHSSAAFDLARRALSAEPFNVTALRVVGLVTASRSDPDAADPIMTLAGNWSLRDAPTQAWLFQQRLRHQDYASAFAHADALMRQIDDAQPPMFQVFAKLVKADPHSLAPLAQRLATNPPWRHAFFDSLMGDPQGQATAAALAVGISNSEHPATNGELSALFNSLVQSHQGLAADQLWRRLSVGATARGQPYDGDFGAATSPEPFGWSILGGEGSTVEVSPDNDRPGKRALRVQYDGYSTPDLIKTYMVLPPGAHRLSGLTRSEMTEGADRLGWVVKCADDGEVLLKAKGAPTEAADVWRPFAAPFSVPAAGCQGQWLQLVAYPGERRTDIAVWYDKLAVTP
jgi:hypothetical protein